VLISHALLPRIPETREVNGALTPFSRRCVSTRQSCWPHLEVFPCVLSCSALDTSLLATWSTQPLGSYLANLSSLRDPWISATCPPRMDGPDPLVASPLATWSIQPLGSYLANLQVHEIPGSLPPVPLGWTAQILLPLFMRA
jgi:hypothetical protein